MLSKKVLTALNEQIHHELASAYLYLAMSAWFEAQNLPGQAKWMAKQAREETGHAMRLFAFVHDCDGRVILQAVAKPPAEFKSIVDVWQRTLAHEEKVSVSIHTLFELAAQARDFPTQAMLQWFVTEQVEEEKTARQILEQAKLIKEGGAAVFFFDRHLGKEAEKE
jgi:ferritin